MPKTIFLVILTFLFWTASPEAFSQKNKSSSGVVRQNEKNAVSEADDFDFYQPAVLRADFKQAAVVADVNVLSFELVDQIGQGGCAESRGVGYCLYRLKAEVKEVFKGKIKGKNLEFYKVTEADYGFKDRMLGRHMVFLGWSDNYPDRKMSLGTLENSTRQIKHNIVGKMRKIARRQN